jgi:hypothetical protein
MIKTQLQKPCTDAGVTIHWYKNDRINVHVTLANRQEDDDSNNNNEISQASCELLQAAGGKCFN